jgi:hypothetical protein
MAGGTTGWDLYATLAEQAAWIAYYKSVPPAACPHDGEPLRQGPPQSPGTLFCPFDGWQYPRDWDPETMSGL